MGLKSTMQDQRSNSPTTEKLEQEIQILEEKVKKLQKEKSDSERLVILL